MVIPGEEQYGVIFSHRHWSDPIDFMLSTLKGGSPSFSFADYLSYTKLFDADILIPGLTVLRIDNGSICPGHYVVINGETVEGVTDMGAYAGREGMHEVKELISETSEWSPSHIYFPQAGPKTLMA
jgi:hypothetical protein